MSLCLLTELLADMEQFSQPLLSIFNNFSTLATTFSVVLPTLAQTCLQLPFALKKLLKSINFHFGSANLTNSKGIVQN